MGEEKKQTNKQTSFLFFFSYFTRTYRYQVRTTRGIKNQVGACRRVVVDGYKTQTNNLPDNVGRFVSIRWNKTSRDIHIKKGGI